MITQQLELIKFTLWSDASVTIILNLAYMKLSLTNHEIQTKKHINLGEHLKLIQYDASVMK